MKWAGALLMLAACWAAGYGKTGTLRRELLCLERLCALLRLAQNELQQRGTPLAEILQRGAWQVPSWRALLLDIAGQLRAGQTVLAAVSPCLKSLPTETAAILRELCSVLGRYDSATQSGACALAISRLEHRQQSLQQELTEKGRLYHTVPLALGMMAVMILF